MEKGKIIKEKAESADSVLAKQKRKTRQDVSSEVPANDVSSSSTCTEHHRTKTGPIRKAQSTSSQRRRRIPSLSLADHDASQTTLEKHNFVRHPQTTPVSAYPTSAVPPNRERIRSCLFQTSSDDKENAESEKQSTEKASTSSSVQRQPLRDHVDQISSKNFITEGTVLGELSGTASTSSASPLDSKPEEHQLLKVCDMVLKCWKAVCTYLCIPAAKIYESQENSASDVSQACFAAMLWWQDGNCREQDSPPTWWVLLAALREAGFPDAAETVQENIVLGVL